MLFLKPGGTGRMASEAAFMMQTDDRVPGVRHQADAETKRTVYLRIVKAQSLWAAGATLCLINPLLSVCFILLVQLIYAFALRGSLLRKIIG